MTGLLYLFGALVLTVALECGLALLFRSRQLLVAVFLCNLLTNPLLNFILLLYYNYICHNYYWLLVVFLEIGVVIGEAFLMKLMTRYALKKAFLLSCLFNCSSFAAGLLLALTGFPRG